MKGNTVSICGNLTRDGEVRQLASGKVALNLGIAWNSSRKTQDGGWEDVPHYFNVKAYMTERQWQAVRQRNAFSKGARCMVVDGHLSYREWQDEGGKKRSAVEVVVDDPMNGLCSVPRSEGGASQGGGGECEPQYGGTIYDEDIPF